MKNSFLSKTKIALVSLVLVSGAAQASSYSVDDLLDKLVRARAAAPTQIGTGPQYVSGNLYVNGVLSGKYSEAGTPATLKVNSAAFTGTATFAKTVAVTGNASVGGALTVGTKRIVGQANSFNPAMDQLLISFSASGVNAKPAMINWAFVTTTTWVAGVTNGRNEPVAVLATNGGLPDIVAPSRPGRSFVGSDMTYTNTTYMWTGKNNSGIDSVRANTPYLVNRPREAAYYSACNQDLTLTSSTRATNQSKVFGWGLTAPNISSFHVGTHSSTTHLTTANNSPFNTGTLFYEIVGDNVSDVTVGLTWDAPLTVGGVLTTFTESQLNELLDSLLALLGSTSLRGDDSRTKMSKAEMIAKLIQHKELLQKASLLSGLV